MAHIRMILPASSLMCNACIHFSFARWPPTANNITDQEEFMELRSTLKRVLALPTITAVVKRWAMDDIAYICYMSHYSTNFIGWIKKKNHKKFNSTGEWTRIEFNPIRPAPTRGWLRSVRWPTRHITHNYRPTSHRPLINCCIRYSQWQINPEIVETELGSPTQNCSRTNNKYGVFKRQQQNTGNVPQNTTRISDMRRIFKTLWRASFASHKI